MCHCYLPKLHFFFCCKQKTAYEMRISDWSSDVCSSDLLGLLGDESVHLVGVGLGEGIADRLETVEQRLGLGDALEDVAGNILCRIELRLLRQVADPDAVGGPRLAGDLGIDAGHHRSEERRVGKECVWPCRSRWWRDH